MMSSTPPKRRLEVIPQPRKKAPPVVKSWDFLVQQQRGDDHYDFLHHSDFIWSLFLKTREHGTPERDIKNMIQIKFQSLHDEDAIDEMITFICESMWDCVFVYNNIPWCLTRRNYQLKDVIIPNQWTWAQLQQTPVQIQEGLKRALDFSIVPLHMNTSTQSMVKVDQYEPMNSKDDYYEFMFYQHSGDFSTNQYRLFQRSGMYCEERFVFTERERVWIEDV